MAGDWIPIRVDLHDDPAVIAMAAKLGIDENAVVGGLVRFWSWASRHTKNGYEAGVTELWLDRFIGRTGWCAAMVSVGWLTRIGGDSWIEGGGFSIPKFDRWNSQTAKDRALTRQRMSKYRARKSDADVTLALRSRNEKVTSTEQNRTEQNKRGTPLTPQAKTLTDHREAGDGKGPNLSIGEQTERAIQNGLRCPETNADSDSSPSPLEAALAQFKGDGGRISGRLRTDSERMAEQHGESRVIAAIQWAASNGRPIGEAWAKVRRETWQAGDDAVAPKSKPRPGKLVAEAGKYDAIDKALGL